MLLLSYKINKAVALLPRHTTATNQKKKGKPIISQSAKWYKVMRFEVKEGTITKENRYYKIVEKIPVGFFVWNIGENMGTHEYIPVCENLHQENKNDYSINPATLKAVKVAPDEWEKLDRAASWGVGNLKQAEKALKSKRKGYTADKKRAAAELTIEIFRRICE